MSQDSINRKTVFGLFQTQTELETAVTQLKQSGFDRDQISVVMPRSDMAQAIAHKNETKAPEGATIGATSGLVLGGTLGWLVGAGALAATGFGPLIAAGPLLAALAGASVGGTLGGLGGALIGLGIPEYEAQQYETAIKGGGTLIAVHTESDYEEEQVRKVLELYGATDISSSASKSEVQRMEKPSSTTYVPPTFPH